MRKGSITRKTGETAIDLSLVVDGSGKADIATGIGFLDHMLTLFAAHGLFDLTVHAQGDLAVDDPWDPEQNVRGGTTYLRRLLDRFGGDLQLALAAYNAGPEAVVQYAGVPPYEETRDYVRKVFHLFTGEDAEVLEGRKVRIERDADNRIRLTTAGLGG